MIKRPDEDLPPLENIRLCHLHFEKNCFERDLQSELMNLPPKNVLKKDAIPTLFSYNKVSVKRSTKVSSRSGTTEEVEIAESNVPYTEIIDEALCEHATSSSTLASIYSHREMAVQV